MVSPPVRGGGGHARAVALISCDDGFDSASGASCDPPCGGPFHGGGWPYVLLGLAMSKGRPQPSPKGRRGPLRESSESTRDRPPRSRARARPVRPEIPPVTGPRSRRFLDAVSRRCPGCRGACRKIQSIPSRAFSSGSMSQPVIRAIRGGGTELAGGVDDLPAVEVGQADIGQEMVEPRAPRPGPSAPRPRRRRRSRRSRGRRGAWPSTSGPGRGRPPGGFSAGRARAGAGSGALRFGDAFLGVEHGQWPLGARGGQDGVEPGFQSTVREAWPARASGRASPSGHSPGPGPPGRAARPGPGRAAPASSAATRPARSPCL